MRGLQQLALGAAVAGIYSIEPSVADATVHFMIQLTQPVDGGQLKLVDPTLKTIAVAGLLALEHFNTQNGVILPDIINASCTEKLSLILSDTEYNEGVALKKLINDVGTTDAVIGALNSFETVPLALAGGALDLPVISYGATSTALDDSSKYPTFSRTIPSDSTAAGAICSLFRSFGYEHATVLHLDDSYGTAYNDALRQACTGENNEDFQLNSVSFRSLNDDSIEAAVNSLSTFEVNVVVAVLFPEDLAKVVELATKSKAMGPGKLWIFTDAITGESLNIVGNLSEDYAQALDGNLRVLALGTSTDNGRFTEFYNYWRDIPANDPVIAKLNQHLNILDPQVVGSFQFSKAFFDETLELIDPAAAYFYDAVVALGKAQCTSPGTLLETVRNSNFEGVTGNIKFLEGGSRDPTTAYFGLFNVLKDEKSNDISLKQVGYLNQQTNKFNVSGVRYPGGLSDPPPAIIVAVEDKNYVNSLVGTSGVVFAAIVMLMGLAFAVWVRTHRKSRVVIHSQAAFLLLLIAGTVVSSLASISIVIDDQFVSDQVASAMCMATPWLYSLGFILAFSALFAKTYRVSKLFNNKRMLKIVVKTKELVVYVIILMVIDFIVLTIWQLRDPLKWVRTVLETDKHGNVVESLGQCQSEGKVSTVCIAALGALHLILLIYGNYLTYHARHVPTTFQESKWVGLSMASMLQLYAISIPLYFAVESDSNARAFVMIGVIFLTNVFLLLVMFVPKIHSLHYSTGETNTSSKDPAELSSHTYKPNSPRRLDTTTADGSYAPDTYEDSTKYPHTTSTREVKSTNPLFDTIDPIL